MPASGASNGALYAIKPKKMALYTKYFAKIAVLLIPLMLV